jgi:hypothetical protein
MKKLLLFLLIAGTFCFASVSSIEDVESPTNFPVTAKLAEGRILIDNAHEAQAASLIREQLLYFVGHLNGFGAGANISQSVITVRKLSPLGNAIEVSYSAEFTVMWPLSYSAPAHFRSVLPKRSDGSGKKDFFRRYGPSCAGGDEPADAESFFYYYRPQRNGCRILMEKGDPALTIPVTLTFSPSKSGTQGQSPEYSKIWEDNQFVATFVLGTFKDGATSEGDVGVVSYNQTYHSILNRFGRPDWMNVNLGMGQNPGLRYPDIEMTFKLPGGKNLNIALLLIQKSALQSPTTYFQERYNARTRISDLVSYNGHSGLGANIRALSKLGEFTAGHYQLYFVNGCDTFTYVDESLTARAAAANPGEAGTKYLDLITNALPSPFGGFARNAIVLLSSLSNSKATYREILGSFSLSQRPLVSGEEDNE